MSNPLFTNASVTGAMKSGGKILSIHGQNTTPSTTCGSVVCYDNASSQSGSIVAVAAADVTTALGKIEAIFPGGVEFKNGLSVTLTNAYNVVIEVE